MNIVRVAMATHLRRNFDYTIPSTMSPPPIGARIQVKLGSRTMIAIVLEYPATSDVPLEKLRPISQVIDTQPIVPSALHQLLVWAADYYHYHLGNVYLQALPKRLREGQKAQWPTLPHWQITENGKQRLLTLQKNHKAPRQCEALELLGQQAGPVSRSYLLEYGVSKATLTNLAKQEAIREYEQQVGDQPWHRLEHLAQDPLKLNRQQAVAVAAINSKAGQFKPFLIEGITGSGKTEVYLQILEPILRQGQQALILVPEIGLTPQTIDRFKQRFQAPMAIIHSGLNDTDRMQAWLAARDKQVAIVIGTRSALFTPLDDLGMIIIDEEHDASFKQQDTFRYHARDVALMRGKLEQCPVVMGSATPALESLHNALSGRYQHLQLTERAGHASLARYELIDICNQPLRAGLSPQLLAAMQQTLAQGQQVMLFLNRRGFAPALLCHECGHVVECQRCERFYTLHQSPPHLACHHCGSQRAIPQQCSECGSTHLVTTGVGTEQLEEEIQTLFKDYAVIRIDRDSTRRKGALDTTLKAILNNEYQILIGTQMLAKGHHFPNVTLVAILDIDHALFSSDFRASERLAQLFIQVAGRAGRSGMPGTVYLQTHHPEHELLQDLVNNGYGDFARFALQERRETQLPPFCYQALLRVESTDLHKIHQLSHEIEQFLSHTPLTKGWVLPLTESPIPKRAGKYRYQQISQSSERRALHLFIHRFIAFLENNVVAKRVRWSIDIDPIDMI